jgi:hypothetical protein
VPPKRSKNTAVKLAMPASRHGTKADTTEAVDAFMATLVHACKPVIEALRRCILEVDPAIGEGIKWNAPSFRTHEYFATTHLREKEGVGVILHLGAKVRSSQVTPEIADPSGLLRWLAPDRAVVRFADEADFAGKREAFADLLRQWIDHV